MLPGEGIVCGREVSAVTTPQRDGSETTLPVGISLKMTRAFLTEGMLLSMSMSNVSQRCLLEKPGRRWTAYILPSTTISAV